jgi:hypothetical protein
MGQEIRLGSFNLDVLHLEPEQSFPFLMSQNLLPETQVAFFAILNGLDRLVDLTFSTLISWTS